MEKMQKEAEELKNEQNIGPHSFHPIYKLGQGSFGQVFLVEKVRPDGTVSDKQYALKVLNKKQILG